MNVPQKIPAATAFTTALVLPAQAQLMTHRDLSYPMARMIVEAAIESCGADGYAVSAVVVDRAGEVMVAMRADGAGLHTMENARARLIRRVAFVSRLRIMRSATPTMIRLCANR